MPVKPTTGISFSSVNVEPPRLDHETIDRINRMWDNMTGEQKMPYQYKALPKFTQRTGRYMVPLELLARQAIGRVVFCFRKISWMIKGRRYWVLFINEVIHGGLSITRTGSLFMKAPIPIKNGMQSGYSRKKKVKLHREKHQAFTMTELNSPA